MGSTYTKRLILVKQVGYGTYATDLASSNLGVIPTGIKGDYHDMSGFNNPGDADQNGLIAPVGRQVQTSKMGEVAFDGDLTFENCDYIFNNGWQKVLTGTGTTSFTRTYTTPATGTINTPLISTIITGDNTVSGLYGYALSDCFIDSWDVGASRGDITKVSGTYLGSNLRTLGSTVYGHINPARLSGTPIQAWYWQHYIDDTTIGNTALTGTVIDWSLKVSSKFHHKQFQDGTILPSSYGQGRPEVTLSYTFEQNAAALAELAKFQAGTARLIRLTVNHANGYSITFSLYGYWTAFDKPGDSDGNSTIGATFKCYYLDTYSNYFQIDTLTGNAALHA